MPIVTVTTPAADRRLCSTGALKTELGIDADDTLFDAWLEAEALSASDLVAAACGVRGDDAGDAPPTFREEIAIVTFSVDEAGGAEALFLPWRRPARVSVVSVSGSTLDPASYRAMSKAGLIERLSAAGCVVPWRRSAAAVTISSGWALGKVPTELQDAVKRLVRLRWESRDRDLAVKAEETDGTGRTEYWVGSMGAGGSALPADVLAALRAGGFVDCIR
ncbi:hypothetical protein AZL_020390 [Azospirillum sp. B510]|uniref:hypothetical protein n=1 Tax=Azospirillum sp. (strain B510) TaxID=137722 RepID=UPI0001C4C359|nr:hypothetical protein [Azospirillum sp. B510]BAI71474.1 hypothetical protein AZL_008360 [Azospirillum sp. B510]BAI72677.1 hypothetical protein AZL_020390 [Azospirillum sp. B510]